MEIIDQNSWAGHVFPEKASWFVMKVKVLSFVMFLICLEGTTVTSEEKGWKDPCHISIAETKNKIVSIWGKNMWPQHKDLLVVISFLSLKLFHGVLVTNGSSSHSYRLPCWKFDEKINVKYSCLTLKAKLKLFLRSFHFSYLIPSSKASAENTDTNQCQA